ncbi:MAG: histidine kinase [Actinomycetota bacterium]|nr:histidine kinase [Actinomycetota bacterium]
MNDVTSPPNRRLSWLAWTLFALAVAFAIAGAISFILGRSAGTAAGWGTGTPAGILAFLTPFVTSAVAGVFLATRKPENLIGWSFLGAGFFGTLNVAAAFYAIYGGIADPGAVPAPEEVDWIALWAWIPGIVLTAVMIPLLFPDGTLTSGRRKLVVLTLAVTILSIVGSAFAPVPLQDLNRPNPFALQGILGTVSEALSYAMILIFPIIIAAVVMLVRRFRRSTGEERLQLKWFAFAAAIAGLGVAASGITSLIQEVISPNQPIPFWVRVMQDLSIFVFTGLPVATGIAIFKYRLYDIDVIINKTVVFAVLAGFVSAIYVAVVVGIGAAVGSTGNRLLPIVAVALIAVAFQPLRERAHVLANRFVYGKRASPYEVLSEFTNRAGGSFSTEEILPEMARVLAEGTGARQAQVWLRIGTELIPSAAYPGEPTGERIPVDENATAIPPLGGFDRAAPVVHRGELLGALGATKPPNEPFTAAEEKLISDLASQAGLVLRNVRLTSELLANLDELRASRQRLVTAQDDERRRLERNIHDGAQQQLVALSVKLRLATAMLDRDQEKTRQLLSELQAETTDALENLRDLARGIFPPLLADQGLAAALDSQLRKVPVPVSLATDGVARYPKEVESAVYFSCLEALQNVSKYANANEAMISLSEENGSLVFSVQDDGQGFDPSQVKRGAGLQNISDRLEAIGGKLEIRSAPGEGTTLVGRIPVRAEQPTTAGTGS